MTPKVRSIPKAQTRLIVRSAEGRERAEFLRFRENYQRKQKQFTETISEQARNLQEAEETKQLVLTEVEKLGKKETGLVKQSEKLVADILQEKQSLSKESARKTHLIGSVEKDVTKHQGILKSLLSQVDNLTDKASDLQVLVSGLEEYIPKLEAAKQEYTELSIKISQSKAENERIQNERLVQLQTVKDKNKDLTEYHEFLKDFSGQLTTRLREVNEMTEYLNEALKENQIPLYFRLPSNKLTEIPF